MSWTKEKPQKVGRYLRTTLWGRVLHATVKVISIDGILYGFMEGEKLAIDRFDENFYWFYIPDPPKDADLVSKQKGEKSKVCNTVKDWEY